MQKKGNNSSNKSINRSFRGILNDLKGKYYLCRQILELCTKKP